MTVAIKMYNKADPVLDFVYRKLEPVGKFLIYKMGIPATDFVLAGGCIRALVAGEELKDVDVFFRNEEAFNKAVTSVTSNPIQVHTLTNAVRITVEGMAVDLVKPRVNQSFPAVHADFDFTVAGATLQFKSHQRRIEDIDAYGVNYRYEDYLDGEFYFHESFFMHVAAKRIILNRLPVPADTVRRLIKYVRKGYKICPVELSKLIRAIKLDESINVEDSAKALEAFYAFD